MIKYLALLYQKYSNNGMRPSCRFRPSCSNYFIEAIERFGVVVGSWITVKRVLRCNQFFEGGYDPVPEGKKR